MIESLNLNIAEYLSLFRFVRFVTGDFISPFFWLYVNASYYEGIYIAK